MKKRLTLLLAFLLLSLTALSCNGGEEPSVPEGAVEVFLAYPGLSYIEEGPYDTSKYGDGTYARYGYTLYVTSENGKLILLPAHTDGSSKAPGVSKDTLMSCKNVQGFGGGLYFDGEKISENACVGMIPSYSNDRLLVFTTDKSAKTGSVSLFESTSNEENFKGSEQTRTIDGEIYLVHYKWKNMFYDAPSEVYVITSKGVVILKTYDFLNNGASFSTIEAVTLEAPEWWKYVSPTSATTTSDGTVFVGEKEGVIGIFPNGELKYYPVDHLYRSYGD